MKPAVIEQKPIENAPATETKADEVQNAAEHPAMAAVAAENPAKPAVVQRTARPKKERQTRPARNDNEQKPANKPERKPLPPKAPAVPLEKPVVTYIPDDQVDPDSPAGHAQSFLKELTHLMGVDVTVAVGNDAEGNVFVQMTGDTLGILIGRIHQERPLRLSYGSCTRTAEGRNGTIAHANDARCAWNRHASACNIALVCHLDSLARILALVDPLADNCRFGSTEGSHIP